MINSKTLVAVTLLWTLSSCTSAQDNYRWPCEYDGKVMKYKSQSGIEYTFIKNEGGWIRLEMAGSSFNVDDNGLNIEEEASTYYRLGDFLFISNELIEDGLDRRASIECRSISSPIKKDDRRDGWYSCSNSYNDPALEFQFSRKRGISKMKRTDDPESDTLNLQGKKGLGAECRRTKLITLIEIQTMAG